MSDQRDRAWRCDCGGGHFLTVMWWPGDVERDMEIESYLNVEGDFLTTWRDRIGQAFRLLHKGHSDTRVGLILSPEKAREVAATLQEFAEARCGR